MQLQKLLNQFYIPYYFSNLHYYLYMHYESACIFLINDQRNLIIFRNKSLHTSKKIKLKVLLSIKKQYLLSIILTYFWLVRVNEIIQNKEILRKTTTGRQLQLYLIIILQNDLSTGHSVFSYQERTFLIHKNICSDPLI